jgi:hypothetical protein
LHRLDDGRVAGKLAHPGESEVGLDLETLVDLLAGLGLVSLDAPTQPGRFGQRNSAEREEVAIGLEKIDLLRRQFGSHRSPSIFDTLRIVSMIAAGTVNIEFWAFHHRGL